MSAPSIEVVVQLTPEEFAALQRYIGVRAWPPAVAIGCAVERELERQGLLRYDYPAHEFLTVEGPTCSHGSLLSAQARCIESGVFPSNYSGGGAL